MMTNSQYMVKRHWGYYYNYLIIIYYYYYPNMSHLGLLSSHQPVIYEKPWDHLGSACENWREPKLSLEPGGMS